MSIEQVVILLGVVVFIVGFLAGYHINKVITDDDKYDL